MEKGETMEKVETPQKLPPHSSINQCALNEKSLSMQEAEKGRQRRRQTERDRSREKHRVRERESAIGR